MAINRGLAGLALELRNAATGENEARSIERWKEENEENAATGLSPTRTCKHARSAVTKGDQ